MSEVADCCGICFCCCAFFSLCGPSGPCCRYCTYIPNRCCGGKSNYQDGDDEAFQRQVEEMHNNGKHESGGYGYQNGAYGPQSGMQDPRQGPPGGYGPGSEKHGRPNQSQYQGTPMMVRQPRPGPPGMLDPNSDSNHLRSPSQQSTMSGSETLHSQTHSDSHSKFQSRDHPSNNHAKSQSDDRDGRSHESNSSHAAPAPTSYQPGPGPQLPMPTPYVQNDRSNPHERY
jgi:hypothetical protein